MTIDVYTDDRKRLDKTLLDAFGRQRTSDPVTLFDYQSEYDKGALLWEESTVGSASTSHDANASTVSLTVTTASGDKVTRQTRQYHRYQPGKSQLIMMTFVMAAGQANCDQRLGYFDNNNGIFLELTGTTLQVVRRTSTSGSPQDNEVTQANWNTDTMADLDITKAQIFFVDMEWLGTGSVRCGFVIDGIFRVAHEFKNANSLSGVYMKTANLPARYEIENTGTVAGGVSLKAICTTVISEGGFESNRGYPFSVSNGATDVQVTTGRRPILTIRPKGTFNSIVNRGTILPTSIQGLAKLNNVFIELIYDAEVLSGGAAPAYTSVNDSSIVEFVAGSRTGSVSGGLVVSSFFLPAAASGLNPQAQQSTPGAGGLGILSRLPLTLDIAGSNPKTLTVCATSLSGTASVTFSMNWQELR